MFVETHGQLLKKLIKRKKLTQAQAAEKLGFTLIRLTRLFNKERIDEITLEEIEKIFQLPPTYFPPPSIQPPVMAGAEFPTHDAPGCWQLLVAAQARIIELQQQLIELSKPSFNAPVRRTKEQPS